MNVKLKHVSEQRPLIRALCNPACYPHPAKTVTVIETHISWVLLAGRYAYKIKKALDLEFLDGTALHSRRFFCEEEIRLNSRLAPQLYLDTVAIGGTVDHPRLGAVPAIEYAVKMRRFAADRQMDRLLAHNRVTPAHIDRLAETMAHFHAALPSAPADTPYGTPEAVRAPMVQNFDQLAFLLDESCTPLLGSLRHASEREYAACEGLIAQRRQQGRVRECHGDLHLGNIALLRGNPMPFDGIDFNASLRWIDVMNEAAFLVMDLLHRGRQDLAYRFLNGYLEISGDYSGVGVLRFYLGYRAMVRAKVAAIRASQQSAGAATAAKAECRGLLAFAGDCLAGTPPALLIMHGLPGCGKTTAAQAALEYLPAIRLRSDVERKRLYGLSPLETSGSGTGSGIYSTEATTRTYHTLLRLAHELLAAGHRVVVDAAFLKYAERAQFRKLAADMALPFVILDVQADPAVLRQRVLARQAHGKDASEANIAVLETLSRGHETLQPDELDSTVTLVNEGLPEDLAAQLASGHLRDKLSVHR